jgi:hypothetical protein
MRYYSDDGPCKHMDVFNGLMPFSQSLVSQPRPPRRVLPEGFLSDDAWLELSSSGFTREEVLQYQNELERGIRGNWHHDKVGCKAIGSYSRRESYNATTTSCLCEDHWRYPNAQCKHMLRMLNIEALASRPEVIRDLRLPELLLGLPVAELNPVAQETILLTPQVVPTVAPDALEVAFDGLALLDNISEVVSRAKEAISSEKALFAKEKEDFRELLGLCCVCYEGKTIRIGCCSAKMCTDCWYSLERSGLSASQQCPCCRVALPQLVEVLMSKFKANLE